MSNNFLANLPNLVMFLRTLLVFVILLFLSVNSLILKIIGLGLLLLIALLDWLDGYIARKLKVSSKIGGLIDTLGDRIIENTLLIFFAYKQLIPVFVPIIFVSRSLLADFIRYQVYQNNIDTFSINKSKLGFILVASKSSRTIYLLFKIVIFLLATTILLLEDVRTLNQMELANLLLNLRIVIYWGSIFLVLFNLLRFILLVYDSRAILRKAITYS